MAESETASQGDAPEGYNTDDGSPTKLPPGHLARRDMEPGEGTEPASQGDAKGD